MEHSGTLSISFENHLRERISHLLRLCPQEATFNYNPNSADKSEINHDVLFREGENQQGHVTYTPRMLLLDLTGSLSHMSQDGELYEDQARAELLTGDPTAVQAHSGWDSGPVEVIHTGPKLEKPEYLKVCDSFSFS